MQCHGGHRQRLPVVEEGPKAGLGARRRHDLGMEVQVRLEELERWCLRAVGGLLLDFAGHRSRLIFRKNYNLMHLFHFLNPGVALVSFLT